MAENNQENESPGGIGGGGAPSVPATFRDVYGDDTVNVCHGTAGVEHFYGYGGNDKFFGGGGGDTYYGGSGQDTVSYWTATAGVKVYLSHMWDNTGAAAGDVYYEIEVVDGSTFEDTIEGDDFSNIFWADRGNDILVGLGGHDTLMGADGDDYLNGGIGSDVLDGGNGRDTASYWDAWSGVRVYLNGSKANGGAAAGDTIIDVEVVDGSRFGDVLVGNTGNNTFWGDAGDDQIDGGAGADVLNGGSGFDSFYFTTALGGSNVDQITEFNPWDDGIKLSTKVFTGILSQSEGSHLASWQFTNGTKATSSNHRIIHDKLTGDLYFDKDGSGAAAQVKFATLQKGLDLSSSNFFTYNPDQYSI
jgi:Ca2+-binding RTX toxin-like protein